MVQGQDLQKCAVRLLLSAWRCVRGFRAALLACLVVSLAGGCWWITVSMPQPLAFTSRAPEPCDVRAMLLGFNYSYNADGEPHWQAAAGRCRCGAATDRCGPFGGLTAVPLPAFVVVTALVDIGGGDRKRGYCDYMRMALPLLSLGVNLTVYIEPKGAPAVRQIREHFGHWEKTLVRVVSGPADVHFHDLLPVWRRAIGRSYLRRAFSHLSRGTGRCGQAFSQEYKIAEYGWINHAKVGFVRDAVLRRDFGGDFFVWADAGGGHGNNGVYPEHWCPCTVAVPGKVTVARNSGRRTPKDPLRKGGFEEFLAGDAYCVHNENMVGTFWGGAAGALLEFYELYNATLRIAAERGVVDDDQPFLEFCASQRSELFQVITSNWYGMSHLC